MRVSGLLVGVAAVTCASAVAVAQPDVIVGDMPNFARWTGIDQGGGNIISAYSIATTSCNLGNQTLQWVQSTNQHPVIPQNMYRLKTVSGSKRFEQIGQSWLKHGFCALQGSLCLSGTPSAPNCTPVCGGCCSSLGLGCSDPYSNTRNGDQSLLGPRQEVNPWTGSFPYPFVLGWGVLGNSINKRIQVNNNDMNPALNAGSLYFAESSYVHPTEGTNANKNNNYSYRRFLVAGTGTGTPIGWNASMTDSTVRTKPAIFAWREYGNGASGGSGVVDPTVTVTVVDDPNGGRFVVAHQVTDLGGGTWHYEYAVLNQNSDRSARAFRVPVPDGVALSNVQFKSIASHSGESKNNNAWAFSQSGGLAQWITDQSFAGNPNANAITWGTMYNFRFDANTAPQNVSAALRTFKVEADLAVTVAAPTPPPICQGDANGDGSIDAADLSVLLSNFGLAAAGPSAGDFNGDGFCDSADLSILLARFGSRC
jgi:hypothetical protein